MLFAVLFFVIFVGLSPPAIRAGIMGSLTLLALGWGRGRSVSRALLYSACAMLLVDPFFIFDKGFQLSFFSTAGIVYVFPVLKKVFENCALRRCSARSVERNDYKGRLAAAWWSELLFLTFAVEIATLPILLSFGQFSLVAPLANVLLLPFIPVFLVLGIAGFIFPFLSVIFEFLLSIYFWAVHLLASLPFATIEIPELSWYWSLVYYVGLVYWIVKNDSRIAR